MSLQSFSLTPSVQPLIKLVLLWVIKYEASTVDLRVNISYAFTSWIKLKLAGVVLHIFDATVSLSCYG